VLGGLAGCKRMPVDQWKLGRSEIFWDFGWFWGLEKNRNSSM
jgi:hypothetical protein